MAIAPQLRALLEEAVLMEQQFEARGVMLDNLSDLHNDLLDWTVNTEHEEAALEVGAILEQHIKKSKVVKARPLSAELVISEEVSERVVG